MLHGRHQPERLLTIGGILMTSRTAWLFAVAVVGLSCGSPTDGCGCEPAVPSAMVFGRLSTTSGAPVENAMVFAYIADDGGCVRHADANGVEETAADGSYRVGFVG